MYVYMAQNCHFGFCVFLTGMVCTLLLPPWSWLLSTGLVFAAKALFGIWAVGKISFSFVRRRGTSGRFKRQTPRRMDGHHLSFPVTVCTVERPGLAQAGERWEYHERFGVCACVCVHT